MYRNSLGFILIILVLLSCNEVKKSQADSESVKQKPNIIFLFSDDQSFKAVHALGNKEIKTPTMDKLAEEGTTFTHTYNMGGWNGAICLASRAMVISGRSIWRAQEISQRFNENNDLDKTWPKLMQSAGYETYATGKWHISAKADSIFNHVGHVLPGMPGDTPEGYNRPLSKNDTIWLPWKKEFGGYWKGGKHWSELIKDDAISFIDSAATREKPFFMYIAFNAPHDPRQSPKEYVDMYPLDSIDMPESFIPTYPYAETMGAGKNLRDEKLAPFPRTEYSVKVNRQEYYAITTHLDDQLKDIINTLEKRGLKENTYIFFSSDHGLAVGEHGLIGKQNMYDHSIRVPMMVIGPNIPKGKKVSTNIYMQDIMATALDLGGVQKPEYVEFNSLMGKINDNDSIGNYDAIYGTYEKNSQRMIIKDGYKLIVYPKSEKILLYNLKEDPQELKDIAEVSGNKEKIKVLFSELMKLQEKMGDQLDLTSIYNNI